jgi:hypothetical protein
MILCSGFCICGKPFFDDGPCHYKCICGAIVTSKNASLEMVERSFCERCMTDHCFNEFINGIIIDLLSNNFDDNEYD